MKTNWLSMAASASIDAKAGRTHQAAEKARKCRTIVLGETTSSLHRECVAMFNRVNRGVRK
jgi:hypothetical protein